MTFPDYILAVFILLESAGVAAEGTPLPADYCQWQAEGDAISEPLCGLRGDAARGRLIAIDSHGGNCLACHRMPIAEEPLHGTVGPPLDGVAARLSAAQLRLRIVDERQLNPATIMPGFYRDPRCPIGWPVPSGAEPS